MSALSPEPRERSPVGASGMQSAKLVKRLTLNVYPGLSHGMCIRQCSQIAADTVSR